MKKYYLYLIQAPNTFKVGLSTNPERRFKEYKTHNSEYEMTGYIEIIDKRIEKIIHTNILRMRYKKFPQRKEWFFGEFSFNRLQEMVNKENKYWSQFV